MRFFWQDEKKPMLGIRNTLFMDKMMSQDSGQKKKKA